MKNSTKDSYLREFQQRDCSAAIAAGFTKAKITSWGRSADRLEVDFEVDDLTYTAIWQLGSKYPDGKIKKFAGAIMIVGWDPDKIWDKNGYPCHNFKRIKDFLDFAWEDIQRREKCRTKSRANTQVAESA